MLVFFTHFVYFRNPPEKSIIVIEVSFLSCIRNLQFKLTTFKVILKHYSTTNHMNPLQSRE